MQKVRKPVIKEYRYKDANGTLRKTWMVIFYDQFDKRQRKQFIDRSEAVHFAEDTYTALLNQGHARRMLSTVLEESVLRECEAMVGKLAGRYQVPQVIEFFLKHHSDPSKKIALSDAMTGFLSFQETRISQASYREFRNTLRNFTNSSPVAYVHEVTQDTVESFLLSLRGENGDAAAPKTWENNRKSLNRFFNWCVERPQQFIAINPCEHVTRKENSALNEIHSLNAQRAEELMRYLEANYPQLVPYYAICMFAGIRPNGEAERLATKTNAIRLDNGIINLTADVTKTGESRHVTIQPNLNAWLTKYGTELFPKNAKRDVAAIRKHFGLDDLKFHDCLRHSFISSHAQCFGSFVQTAIESGNSEKIIRSRYYNTLTTKEDALKFWEIKPTAE